MQRSSKRPAVRAWSLSGSAAAAALMTLAVTGGACAFQLPDRCETLGIICQEGQQCAADQAVCIDFIGCGNGLLEPGEACDDGNTVDGALDDTGTLVLDSCSRDCFSTQECGNSIVDPGEECDQGIRNGAADGICNRGCRLVKRLCGNNIVDTDGDEECDPGPIDSVSCNSNMAGPVGCKASRCGDGYFNAMAGEQCDSGGTDSAQCNGATCTGPVCGDLYVNSAAGESCDSIVDTAGCNGRFSGPVSCHAPACGDGHVNAKFTPPGGSAVEQCDNASGIDSTTCNGNNHGANGPGSCRLPSCGDGYVNPAFVPAGGSSGEQCDALGGDDTASCNGRNSGSASCKLARCGDNHVNVFAGEECDEGVADTGICNGSNTGVVQCKFARCGDDYINSQAGEECESDASCPLPGRRCMGCRCL